MGSNPTILAPLLILCRFSCPCFRPSQDSLLKQNVVSISIDRNQHKKLGTEAEHKLKYIKERLKNKAIQRGEGGMGGWTRTLSLSLSLSLKRKPRQIHQPGR